MPKRALNNRKKHYAANTSSTTKQLVRLHGGSLHRRVNGMGDFSKILPRARQELIDQGLFEKVGEEHRITSLGRKMLEEFDKGAKK